MTDKFKTAPSKVDPLEQQILLDPALLEALAHQDQINHQQSKWPLKGLGWLSLAASFLLVGLVWLMLPQNIMSDENKLDVVQLSSLHKSKDVVLPDGSQIALNSHSQLHYLPSERKRIVTFDNGEAFFDVARDESRPFVIASRNTTITVLGTAFNLDVSVDSTQLNVFHGKVKVENLHTGEQNILTKGQGLFLDSQGNTKRHRFNHQKPLWQSGWVAFSDMPLKHAISKLNRYADKRLIVGPGLGNLAISGRFKTAEAEDAVMLIAQMHQLKVSEFADSLVLEKNGHETRSTDIIAPQIQPETKDVL